MSNLTPQSENIFFLELKRQDFLPTIICLLIYLIKLYFKRHTYMVHPIRKLLRKGIRKPSFHLQEREISTLKVMQ